MLEEVCRRKKKFKAKEREKLCLYPDEQIPDDDYDGKEEEVHRVERRREREKTRTAGFLLQDRLLI